MGLTYEVIIGVDRAGMSAEDARAAWDGSPDELRQGRREGAFILWGEDELGRRVSPIIFRPRKSPDG